MRWLVRIWPFSRIAAWLEWRRRDREETLVATLKYWTEWTRNGEKTGLETDHLVRFMVDGNGVRYCRVDSGPKAADIEAGKTHPALRRDKFNWQHHGDIPDRARRPDNRPRGKLILLDGGAA